MSQSATLYRVSQDIFKQLDKTDNKQRFDINSAKSYSVFQGSFMALEYILSKGQNSLTTELVTEIFNPKNSLGRQTFERLSLEEQFDFYESGLFIPYLDTSIIRGLNDFLVDIRTTDISSKYDSKELNDNGIYPQVWHDDNSPDKAYNHRHILEDFEELKTIIKQADAEQDYIFVFVG